MEVLSKALGSSVGRGFYEEIEFGYYRDVFAVGMPVARHPPHRSQHAELPHWAPALGDDAQALLWIRMLDFGVWKPAFHEATHSLPVDSSSLTPTP